MATGSSPRGAHAARWRQPALRPVTALLLALLAAAPGRADAEESAVASAVAVAESPGVARYSVVGDAIPNALTGVPGDAQRGRAIVASRQTGLCLLCHGAPIAEERFQGNLAPDLRGAGSRWTPGQLRLRIVDGKRLDPGSIMPSYHRTDGLVQVGRPWQRRPVLDAQQVEDVVAYLATLRP